MSQDLLSSLRTELDARLDELRPLRSEYERLLVVAEALGAGPDGALPPLGAEKTSSATQRGRARSGAARHAILAALERSSHTTSELLSITGVTAPNIRYNLHRMLLLGAISKTERSGQTVWHALTGSDQRGLTRSVQQERTNVY